MSHRILLLPGDGIGPEIAREAHRLLEKVAERSGETFTFLDGEIGGASIDTHGTPLTEETVTKARAADAVLMGAVGGPKWENLDFSIRPERGLLGIRRELGLFANLRPALVFDALADASTLKREVVAGLDIMIVRELTGGIYFGEPRGIEDQPDGSRKGYNTLVYTTPEIHRIAEVAFDLAEKRNKRVCSVDKANVLQSTVLWREEVENIARRHPEVALSHMYVDNAAMQLVRNPAQFDVIVTGNMFGDILSDCAAMLTGSLGMLPSASLGQRDENTGHLPALYEPVHGSAPDIAGEDKANPLAMILSAAMMLRYSLNMPLAADQVETAVETVLARGLRTGDIMGEGGRTVSTTEMGSAIIEAFEELA